MVPSPAGTITRRDLQSSGIDREGLLKMEVKIRNPFKADFLQAASDAFRSDYGQDLYLEMLKDYVYENITSFSFDGATSLSDSLFMSPSASPTDVINNDDLHKENEHMFPSSSPSDLLETTVRLAAATAAAAAAASSVRTVSIAALLFLSLETILVMYCFTFNYFAFSVI